MIASLRGNMHDLQVMGEPEVAKLQRWRDFCVRHAGFCVVYAIDF